jgi:uncharacterized YigZ family protein
LSSHAALNIWYTAAMLIVALEPARRELSVLNSRFIASLAPVESVAEAKAFIASIRHEFPDASHHVPAFIIGGGNSVSEFCSDDGEPSGTSGKPLLATLKGSGLGNVAVVVSRYFGGTLLGTGGLVKAYSEAGKAVLGSVRRAELVPSRTVAFSLPYTLFERARQYLEAAGARIAKEDFAEDISIEAELPEAGWAAFSSRMAELGAGSLTLATRAQGSMKLPLNP